MVAETLSPTVLIGIGSSLGPRLQSLRLAASLLESWRGIQPIARSRVYLSSPMGPALRPFLNAAIRVRWSGGAYELLDICKAIEDRIGRQASCRWMDRVIDLDLLLIGEQMSENPRLQLPHPGLLERAFALVPAAEIGGDLVHPEIGRPLRECLVPSPSGLVLWGCL